MIEMLTTKASATEEEKFDRFRLPLGRLVHLFLLHMSQIERQTGSVERAFRNEYRTPSSN